VFVWFLRSSNYNRNDNLWRTYWISSLSNKTSHIPHLDTASDLLNAHQTCDLSDSQPTSDLPHSNSCIFPYTSPTTGDIPHADSIDSFWIHNSKYVLQLVLHLCLSAIFSVELMRSIILLSSSLSSVSPKHVLTDTLILERYNSTRFTNVWVSVRWDWSPDFYFLFLLLSRCLAISLPFCGCPAKYCSNVWNGGPSLALQSPTTGPGDRFIDFSWPRSVGNVNMTP